MLYWFMYMYRVTLCSKTLANRAVFEHKNYNIRISLWQAFYIDFKNNLQYNFSVKIINN